MNKLGACLGATRKSLLMVGGKIGEEYIGNLESPIHDSDKI